MHLVLPVPPGAARWYASSTTRSMGVSCPPFNQGLTPVHFSAQLERYLWDRGCVLGLIRGRLGGLGRDRGCV